MVQKKLNKKKVIIAVSGFAVLIAIIVLVTFLIKSTIKRNSIEYKLEAVGYSVEEIEYLKQNLTLDEQKELLNNDYLKILVPLYKEKYFRKDKLKEYLNYYNDNKNLSASEIVTKINTHTNIDFYDEIYEADLSKKELVLVNKYFKLNEDYEPSDIVLVPSTYAYSGKYVSEYILESLESLIDAANEYDLKLVVSAGYRSYKDQESIYNSYKVSNGIKEADAFVSRPGHSDYQTGLAVDIEPYAKAIESVSESEEYIWLMNNMHRFGFIQRFPEGQENITGFKYSAWHLRYVGIEAATYIHNNSITFEEYYGYKF